MGGVAEQCRALDNHNYYVFISRFTPYEFNLQVFVNCLYLNLALLTLLTKMVDSQLLTWLQALAN